MNLVQTVLSLVPESSAEAQLLEEVILLVTNLPAVRAIENDDLC